MRGNAASAGAVAVGLVALLSLTKRTPSRLADALHAVREAGVGAEALLDLVLRQSKCLANRDRRLRVFAIVRSLKCRPVAPAQAGARNRARALRSLIGLPASAEESTCRPLDCISNSRSFDAA